MLHIEKSSNTPNIWPKMKKTTFNLALNPFFSEILNLDSLLIAFFVRKFSYVWPFFGLVAMKAKLFCPFSIKSKQGTSKEVIIEVKQKFFKKHSVIYCWNECHIQCWKKRDTHFNTQFNNKWHWVFWKKIVSPQLLLLLMCLA